MSLVVQIDGKDVDAGDYEAIAVACKGAVANLNLASTDAAELEIDLRSAMGAIYTAYVAIGAVLQMREHSGLVDHSLGYVRAQLGSVIGLNDAAPSNEPQIVVPGE